MTAPTLDGRLLCASGAAYAVTLSVDELALDPQDVYAAGAGFVRPPRGFVAGLRDIDACLVAETVDGVVVAFRGTLPFDIHQVPTVFDWVNDINALPAGAPGFPGQVHLGFLSALDLL